MRYCHLLCVLLNHFINQIKIMGFVARRRRKFYATVKNDATFSNPIRLGLYG